MGGVSLQIWHKVTLVFENVKLFALSVINLNINKYE